MPPLRKIVDRPSNLLETLDCGHTIPRPLGLGEDAMTPAKAKKRRDSFAKKLNTLGLSLEVDLVPATPCKLKPL